MTENEFIELIKKKRLDQLMTQKQLAYILSISNSKYCKIEGHKQNLTFNLIKRLAEIFELDLNIIKTSPKKDNHYFD